MLPPVRPIEISFILGTLGVSLGLLTKEGMNLVLAAAIFNHCAQSNFFSVWPDRWRNCCAKHFRFGRTAAARLDPQSTMPDEVEK